MDAWDKTSQKSTDLAKKYWRVFNGSCKFVAHLMNGPYVIALLSLDDLGEDKKLPVDAAVADVVVAAEAVEPVVAVVPDHPAPERAVGVVATKLFAAPLVGNKKDIFLLLAGAME